MIIDALSVTLGLNDSQFSANLLRAEGNLTRFSRRADRLAAASGKLGRSLTMRLSLPIAGAGLGALKFASDFDSAMTQSLAIVKGVTPALRGEMESLAQTMATKSTFSAKEAADSYYYLASAGLDIQESMESLPVVTQFAQAGMFDMASATDLLTDAYSALGPQIAKTGDLTTDMTRLSDLLVGANTLANASVQQFSEALTNEAAAAMRAYGVTVEDGIGILAAYADQGIKGAPAGSMMGRMLRLLTKAAIENSSVFEEMGVQVFDSSGKLRGQADIIKDLEKAMSGLSTQQKIVALDMLGFQARSQQAILPLLGAGDAVATYSKKLDDMGGKTKQVADIQMESFAAQLKTVQHRVQNAGISMGEDLMPFVLELADKVENLATWFSELSEEERKNVIQIAAIAGLSGPVLLFFSSMVRTTSDLAKATKWLIGLKLASAKATDAETAALGRNTLAKGSNAGAGAVGGGARAAMTTGRFFKGAAGITGAGAAGWMAGRGISKLFGLDEKLAKNLWKPLLGGTELQSLGDLSGEKLRKAREEAEAAKKKAEVDKEAIEAKEKKEDTTPAIVDLINSAMAEKDDEDSDIAVKKKDSDTDDFVNALDESFTAAQKGSAEEYRQRMAAQNNLKQYQDHMIDFENRNLQVLEEIRDQGKEPEETVSIGEV